MTLSYILDPTYAVTKDGHIHCVWYRLSDPFPNKPFLTVLDESIIDIQTWEEWTPKDPTRVKMHPRVINAFKRAYNRHLTRIHEPTI